MILKHTKIYSVGFWPDKREFIPTKISRYTAENNSTTYVVQVVIYHIKFLCYETFVGKVTFVLKNVCAFL